MRNIPYREAVGALLRASTITGPDMADAVRSVGRYCEKSGQEHWKAVDKILDYLRGTLDVGITYDGKDGKNDIVAYVYADHAMNIGAKRSVSGGLIMLASAAVYHFSRMQRVSALFIKYSEYMATGEVAMPGVEENCVKAMEDNERATIILADNPISSHRTKHIDATPFSASCSGELYHDHPRRDRRSTCRCHDQGSR